MDFNLKSKRTDPPLNVQNSVKKKLTFHFHAEDYNPNTQQKA